MLKNLVTGGTGFLGSHLVEALVAREEQVRVLVRPTSNISHLEDLGVELTYGDLNDLQSREAAIRNADRVYHCAALSADWGAWEAFRSANVISVRNLLDAALVGGVQKFIHISTTDVYGHPDFPADEGAPCKPRGWPYGDTKIEGEQLVWEYYYRHNLPVTVIRPVSIYGPRSVTLVLDIVDLLKSGSMLHIGSGIKSAGLGYVTNVVEVILRAADTDNAVGEAYNASDGSDITWREYVDRLADIVRVPRPRAVIPYWLAYVVGWAMEKVYGTLRIKSRPLLTRMAAAVLGTDQGFPIDKARRELDYEPKVDFDEGMRRVEVWLRTIGYITKEEQP